MEKQQKTKLFRINADDISRIKIYKYFFKINPEKNIIKQADFIFLLALMIIDETDTLIIFYKYNLSKKDQKRIKIIDNFYKDKITSKNFKK